MPTLLAELASIAGMPSAQGPPVDGEAGPGRRSRELERLAAEEGWDDLDGELAALRLTIEHGPGTHAQRKEWLVELERARAWSASDVARSCRAPVLGHERRLRGGRPRARSPRNLDEWEVARRAHGVGVLALALDRGPGEPRSTPAGASPRPSSWPSARCRSLRVSTRTWPCRSWADCSSASGTSRDASTRSPAHLDEATLGMVAILVPVFHGDAEDAARLLDPW